MDDDGKALGLRGAQAVGRAIAVMRAVARTQRSRATMARLSRDTGLTRSTTFRILRALTEERMLSFDGGDRSYAIGPLAYELGLAGTPERPLPEKWHAAIATVAKETRLTSYLIKRSGDEAVCVHCVQGAAAIRAMPFEIGQRVPLGFGAGSLAILSSLDDPEVERIIYAHRQRRKRVSRDVAYLDRLPDRIARTRRDGYATSTGTVAAGVSGVGVLAPIESPHVPLALTVSAVTPKLSAQDANTLAQQIAAAIQRLHY